MDGFQISSITNQFIFPSADGLLQARWTQRCQPTPPATGTSSGKGCWWSSLNASPVDQLTLWANLPMRRPPNPSAEAPAVSLAQHTEALREELDDREVFSKLSTSGLGCQPKNASRQYKRTVKRFGLSVTLGSLQWLNLFISGTTQLKMDFLMLIQPLYILRALLALISGTFRHPTISMRRMGLWSDLPTCGPLISWDICWPMSRGYSWVYWSQGEKHRSYCLHSGNFTGMNMDLMKSFRWQGTTRSN